MNMKTGFLATVLAGAFAASGALAQDQSTNRVAVETDWNVFFEY